MNSIVVLDALTCGGKEIFERFSSLGNLKIYETTTPEQRKSHIAESSIVITNKVLIDKEIIDSCPSLKLVCLTATGMNNVDIPYAESKGIQIKNVAGYSTESVAQHTFAMLLSLLHHTNYYSKYVQSKEYSNQSLFTHIGMGYWELKGKTWGIIGLGSIGRRVAQIAEAFGCNVIYYSTSGKNSTQDYIQKDLHELLALSDIVSIHSPLNQQTMGLIGTNEFTLMKKTAYIINVGRGGIIVESDLANALENNIIEGACVDVMQNEPLPNNSTLLNKKFENKLLITPHIAWISKEALQTLIQKVFENVEQFIEK